MPEHFLYERLYDFVLEEISESRLRPGDRVPSESELAERFGVSRITSKRALRMLADAGVVDRRRGKGSFVAADARRLGAVRESERRAAPAAPAVRERAGGTGCLALVLPDASETYGLDLMCAIEERAAEHGYHLVVRRTRDSQRVEEEAIRALAGGTVDGMIVFPVHGEFYNATLVRLVLDGSPLVLVDRYLPGIPACAVCTDNAAASRVLTEYVLDRGHTEVAFVSPPVENTTSIEERIQGYRSALHERGVPAAAERCFTGLQSTLPEPGSDSEAGADRAAIRAFLDREPAVTGFVVCEYNLAVLVREVLTEVGRWDPARCLVACFDSPWSRAAAASFPHIRQGQQEMGRRAVDLLVAQLNGEDVPRMSAVPFELVAP
ncbi:GntR family transcriptional regulator [Actinopolymorpha sp. NPDC004070]|uniref:GntR family transcriptional regulator n=1 Tax=Actinopolymorpha sp. NPDC004070 TaxID=3154548 RepID=UPI0033B282F3